MPSPSTSAATTTAGAGCWSRCWRASRPNPWRYAELEVDHRVVDRDGQPVVLLIRARPVPSTGELAGVIADVTEHRAAEMALRDLLDRYRFLVDHSPDAIVVHQMGVVRFVNPAAMEFARLVTAEETGNLDTEPAHPDVAAEMLSRIGGLNEPGAVPEPAETRIVRPDGSELIVESTGVRTTWDGEPAVQVILRDITERRAARGRDEGGSWSTPPGTRGGQPVGRAMLGAHRGGSSGPTSPVCRWWTSGERSCQPTSTEHRRLRTGVAS